MFLFPGDVWAWALVGSRWQKRPVALRSRQCVVVQSTELQDERKTRSTGNVVARLV